MTSKDTSSVPYQDHDSSEGAHHNELDRRIYHLKTLYDLSEDIFGTVDCQTILRNFLLMTAGNFGVLRGFIYVGSMESNSATTGASVGLSDEEMKLVPEQVRKLLVKWDKEQRIWEGHCLEDFGWIGQKVECALPFALDETCVGILGLGPKIVGDHYSEDDKELLVTLLNNLLIALKNAKSFEEISRLNEELQRKNLELEKSLNELQTAMKKVELLESIKTNLAKFVPNTVTRMLEMSPTSSLSEASERDVSVLFIDIEGYTRLSERLPSVKLNELVEKYFSVFLDAIYMNNGDVNETAGDGLMVLFLSDDRATNAFEAVNAALAIKGKLVAVNREENIYTAPLVVNMGINSGQALVGAVKFESYTGSRWTYTARGFVTNVAARLAALATDGAILLTKDTADRVKGQFPLTPFGTHTLKNVSSAVEVFRVE